MKRKLLALLLAALLLLMPATVIAESGEGELIFFQENRDYLATGAEIATLEQEIDLPAFKAYLTEQIASCPERIDILSFGIDAAYKDALSAYIFDEMPELFHLDNRWGYAQTGSGTLALLAFYYTCDADTYAEMLSQLRAEASYMTSGLDNEKLTDAEKALILHDRLVVHCEYDYDNLNAGTLPKTSYTAYGALVARTAVCQGYAEAYDYMLEMIGIESSVCESGALNHAWNLVYIDGKAYHVDATWNDPVLDRNGYVDHINFLRSNDGIYSTGHSADDYDTAAIYGDYPDIVDYYSESAYVLLNGEIYYFQKDGTAAKLMRKSDSKHFLTVDEHWLAGENSYWGENYSCLATDGRFLYFNTPGSIIRLDVATNETTTLFDLDASAYPGKSIVGFKYDHAGYFVFDVSDSPWLDGETNIELTMDYTPPTLTGDVNGDNTVSTADLITLSQLIASSEGSAAGDINGDGEVGTADLIVLAQMIAAQ